MRQANRRQTGTVFNIQKFSVNDGPGIRTVVFFKGCPLRCRWCANPESQMTRPQVLWTGKRCIGCLHCVNICPNGAVSHSEEGIHIAHDVCAGCGRCVAECPARALEMQGEERTVQQVLDVVLQDRVFYEEGGGITLSGGEFLAQPAFAEELLLAAKEEGLHTCCETTGFAPPAVYSRVIDLVDDVLFDVKHWDPEKHLSGTGVSNELPLANLRTTIALGKRVLPRIPVIPGFNDSENDAGLFSALLRGMSIHRCQLLPFHQFGENKYHLLGRDYAYEDVPALHREELRCYAAVFQREGIDAYF